MCQVPWPKSWVSGVREEREKGTYLPRGQATMLARWGESRKSHTHVIIFLQTESHPLVDMTRCKTNQISSAPSLGEGQERGTWGSFPPDQLSSSFSSWDVSSLKGGAPGFPSQLCQKWQNRGGGDWEAAVWSRALWWPAASNVLVSRAAILKTGCAHSRQYSGWPTVMERQYWNSFLPYPLSFLKFLHFWSVQ